VSAVRRLSTAEADFDRQLAQLLAFDATQDERIETTVASILADVRKRGDEAVLEYTRRFDQVDAGSLGALELPRSVLAEARGRLPAAQGGFAPTTNASCCNPGSIRRATAPPSDRKSRRWIG
jgi:histidinol dehydrogenase